MLPLLLAAAVTTAPPLDARQSSLLAMMQREGVCTDTPEDACAQMAATAQIRPLGTLNGLEVGLVTFPYDTAKCGSANCPYVVATFGSTGVRKLLWTDGYSITVGSGSPLPALRVTSHDSADTSYVTRFEWHDGQYVRSQYLQLRLATGETRPEDIPLKFTAASSSTTVHGAVTHYWDATFELRAQTGQQLTISNVKAALPLWIMLDGPDGLPISSQLTPGTPYTLPSSGTYELSIYLNTTQDVENDQPFELTVSLH